MEYLDDLIEKNIVKKVKNSEELIDYIIKDENDEMELKEYNKDYFFKNYEKSIFKDILK